MKILVVDDSSFMRRIIRSHLSVIGFKNIVEASNGREALEVLKNEKIDLILSDWCMQGMYGIELLKAVRRDSCLAEIPFIMLTAEGQNHSVQEAFDAEVSGYIVKPFTPDVLEKHITRVMEKKI